MRLLGISCAVAVTWTLRVLAQTAPPPAPTAAPSASVAVPPAPAPVGPAPPAPPASAPSPVPGSAESIPPAPPLKVPTPPPQAAPPSAVEERTTLRLPVESVHAPSAPFEAANEDIERRVVVFTDGAAPQLVSSGPKSVRGPLELEIRFRNANPLCYEYSTNVAASRVAASDLPLPERVPGIGSLGAQSSSTFSGLDDAFTAVNAAQTDLDEVLNAARMQASLEDVWAACDGRADSSWQRARVEAAARILAQRVGPMGSWRQVLERAESTALGGKRLARDLETGEQEAVQDVEARKAALSEVERKEQALRDQLSRSGPTRKLKADLEDAARDIASAQRHLREAELKLNRHRRAGDLGRAAERLADRVNHTLEVLSANVAEINRARSLLARSPTAIRRRFGAGETVRVVVERARLERGERVEGRPPQAFEVPAYHTLRPVIIDVGVGPALGIGHNTAQYATEFSPRSIDDTTTAYRVVRTEQGIPLDAVVTLSAYLWGSRYFDDGVFDGMQLVPRPMIGVSLAHPLSTFYAGFSIDPIQFLDISGGVRWANEERLIGPATGERALVTPEGVPQPPVTREEVRPMAFASVTVSTNLLYSWITTKL